MPLICRWCGNDYDDVEVYSCPSCGEESCVDCAGRCGCDLSEEMADHKDLGC